MRSRCAGCLAELGHLSGGSLAGDEATRSRLGWTGLLRAGCEHHG